MHPCVTLYALCIMTWTGMEESLSDGIPSKNDTSVPRHLHRSIGTKLVPQLSVPSKNEPLRTKKIFNDTTHEAKRFDISLLFSSFPCNLHISIVGSQRERTSKGLERCVWAKKAPGVALRAFGLWVMKLIFISSASYDAARLTLDVLVALEGSSLLLLTSVSCNHDCREKGREVSRAP